ncbi:MAG: hypothetical protein CL920_05960 [Deltaproteobacteria bacterium]|nr:hypothetical protein [Deltaproteobacteria bacterium]
MEPTRPVRIVKEGNKRRNEAQGKRGKGYRKEKRAEEEETAQKRLLLKPKWSSREVNARI